LVWEPWLGTLVLKGTVFFFTLVLNDTLIFFSAGNGASLAWEPIVSVASGLGPSAWKLAVWVRFMECLVFFFEIINGCVPCLINQTLDKLKN
jgi:hypothetical protein